MSDTTEYTPPSLVKVELVRTEDAERFEEKKMAVGTIQNDYSSLMKFLITLASACIGFSATLVIQQSNSGIAIAMCFWGGCLVLTIGALGYSIWAQDRNINLLADERIEFDSLWERQPSNLPQNLLMVHAVICFVIGIVIFIIAVWPMQSNCEKRAADNNTVGAPPVCCHSSHAAWCVPVGDSSGRCDCVHPHSGRCSHAQKDRCNVACGCGE